MTYSEKLLDPRWQKKRLQVLERENFTCQLCGNTQITLHVHHLSYSDNPWDSNLHELQCLCKYCHESVTYINKNYKHWEVKKVSTNGISLSVLTVHNEIVEYRCLFMFSFNGEGFSPDYRVFTSEFNLMKSLIDG
jgi:hypothetical protein